MYQVMVSPSLPFARDESRFFEVGDDSFYGAFANADLHCEFAKANVRLFGYAEEDVGVGRQ
jgi:hypothetical protein